MIGIDSPKDWIGLDSLYIRGKPLANGYYTRHPVKCTVDRNEKQNKMDFIIEFKPAYYANYHQTLGVQLSQNTCSILPCPHPSAFYHTSSAIMWLHSASMYKLGTTSKGAADRESS